MIFLDHSYNADKFALQREEVWNFLNNELNLRGLGEKTNVHIKVKNPIPDNALMFKANDWLNSMVQIFNYMQFDLVEVILANRLRRDTTDDSSRIYFLINFRHHTIGVVASLYSFWNVTAQYLNVLFPQNPIKDFLKHSWKKEEDRVDCGYFENIKQRNAQVQKICGQYHNDTNKNLLKLRNDVIHRHRIPIHGLGKDYYTRISEGVIEFFAERESNNPDHLEKEIMDTVKKLPEVIMCAFSIFDEEIKRRKQSNFIIT